MSSSSQQPSFDVFPMDDPRGFQIERGTRGSRGRETRGGREGRSRGRGSKRSLDGFSSSSSPSSQSTEKQPVFVPTPSPPGSMAARLKESSRSPPLPQQKPELILIRGPPGSGKSTAATFFIKKGFRSMCTDDYFTVYNSQTKQKEYQFDESKLGEYHKRCLEQTKTLLRCGNNVVVHNTFRTKEEIQPYLNAANLLGVDVMVLRMASQFKSTKDIPEKVMKKYLTQIDRIDGERQVRYDVERQQLAYIYYVDMDDSGGEGEGAEFDGYPEDYGFDG